MVEPAAARGCCCRKPRAALMIPPSVTTLLLSFEGKLVKESRSWEEWTGQTLEQAGGLGWLDAHHPDDRKDTKTHLLLRSDPQGANNVLTRLWSRKHNSYRYMIARIDAKEQDTRCVTLPCSENLPHSAQGHLQRCHGPSRSRAKAGGGPPTPSHVVLVRERRRVSDAGRRWHSSPDFHGGACEEGFSCAKFSLPCSVRASSLA